MERTGGGVEIESKSLERVVQTPLRGVGTSTVTRDGQGDVTERRRLIRIGKEEINFNHRSNSNEYSLISRYS